MYVLIVLIFITGMLKEFAMVFAIILVHEFGHLMAALYFKWNTGKIVIYPFGGCCKFDEIINKSIKEELIILFSGPFTQIVFNYLVFFLTTKGFMTYRNYYIFQNYHYTLLFFNLLPIYPLDGGRILNNILGYCFPFKKSNKIVIFISFVFIVLSLFFYKNLNFTIMAVLLFFEILFYLKKQDFLFNRMLLERYMRDFNFKKFKIINDKNNMYKNKRHIIFYKNRYITEKEYLKERFKVNL